MQIRGPRVRCAVDAAEPGPGAPAPFTPVHRAPSAKKIPGLKALSPKLTAPGLAHSRPVLQTRTRGV